MSWNYRVVKTLYPKNMGDSYAIHEVYYDDKGKPNSLSANETSPSGETREEFRRSYIHYGNAIYKPVIVFDNETNKFTGEEEPPLVKRLEEE